MELLLLGLVLCAVEGARQPRLVQESCAAEFVDKRHINIISAELSKVNETTKVLNLTAVVKTPIPEDFRVSTRGYKNINNEYKLVLFRYDTTVKKGLEVEYFDMQSLFLKYTHPPLTWPLKTNVVYRSIGWHPDVGQWLPNFPEGRYKFQLTYFFPTNKTKVLVVNWFCRIER